MEKNDSKETKRGYLCHRPSVPRIIGMTLLGVVAAVFFALVFGVVVMWLWNWLMPALFGLGSITFWQAFGILLLAKLLFGGLGHHHRDHHDHLERRIHAKMNLGHGHPLEDGGYHPGNGKKWRNFRLYWEKEGKAAFEDYMGRAEEAEEKEE